MYYINLIRYSRFPMMFDDIISRPRCYIDQAWPVVPLAEIWLSSYSLQLGMTKKALQKYVKIVLPRAWTVVCEQRCGRSSCWARFDRHISSTGVHPFILQRDLHHDVPLRVSFACCWSGDEPFAPPGYNLAQR